MLNWFVYLLLLITLAILVSGFCVSLHLYFKFNNKYCNQIDSICTYNTNNLPLKQSNLRVHLDLAQAPYNHSKIPPYGPLQ